MNQSREFNGNLIPEQKNTTLDYAIDNSPEGTCRLYNVALTSMQRHDLNATLYKRHVPTGSSPTPVMQFKGKQSCQP